MYVLQFHLFELHKNIPLTIVALHPITIEVFSDTLDP